MSGSMDTILLGGLIRVLQGLVAAGPTLLVGLLIAAILRYYLAASGTRRLFGGDSLRSLPQSWLVGMLLPVCSIGVLPILREMRRAGVKPGAMTAFALSAPLFNPLSLLYGLTLGRPLVIIFFAVGSLAIVTLLGAYWDAINRLRVGNKGSGEGLDSGEAASVSGDRLIGLRRLAATCVHMAREASGPTLGWMLLALTGLAVLAAVLPFGAMQSAVERDDGWAPLKMLAVAIPVYATPMLAMSQLGMMFQHANSPGAAFTLLILGAGMNLATPIWFGRHYGAKSATLWLVTLLLVVLGISYAVNRPLIPPGVEPAGHTHAFDIYTNPLSAYDTTGLQSLWPKVSESLDVATTASLALLALIAVTGGMLRGLAIDEAYLLRTAKTTSLASSLTEQNRADRRGLDVVVPPGVIGACLLAGLVAMSVVACFAYYPPPKQCLDEIGVARAECLSAANSGQIEHALYWLPIWEDWSRRLEVGTFLRSGRVRPYQRMQGYLIRKKLETLEHELEHDPLEMEEVRAVVKTILATNNRWVAAFRPE